MQNLLKSKRKFLCQSNLNWNSTTKLCTPTEYFDNITNIIYQYDIAIESMFHYFDAINLNNANTYRNLMLSFDITLEFDDFVNEFIINNKKYK